MAESDEVEAHSWHARQHFRSLGEFIALLSLLLVLFSSTFLKRSRSYVFDTKQELWGRLRAGMLSLTTGTACRAAEASPRLQRTPPLGVTESDEVGAHGWYARHHFRSFGDFIRTPQYTFSIV